MVNFAMPINSYETLYKKSIPSLTTKSSFSQRSNLSSYRLMKIDCAADSRITSCNSKDQELKTKKSPFIRDRFQTLAKTTESKHFHKKTDDFVSSFPLAVSIYKTSSDQLKNLKKNCKKVKKSVLTLPNEPAPLPQTCTVSDVNDSEHFNETKDEQKPKAKNRRSLQSTRKPRFKIKGVDVFDKDARYCSQLNIDLDNSSTHMINQFVGDGQKKSKKRINNFLGKPTINDQDFWAVLRDMNRLQFRPSPPLSQDNVVPIKRRKSRNNRRKRQVDTKFIETSRTEQFTYISSLVDETPHNSLSSIDCVTIIDKRDEYQEFCEEIKVIKNNIPSKEKSHKVIKSYSKNKSSIHVKQNNHAHEEDNDELRDRNHLNEKRDHRLCRSLENKSDVTNAGNNTNIRYIKECITGQNKPGKICKDHDDLCGYSDSINGDIRKYTTNINDDQIEIDEYNPNESQLQINGITKVVLSKGQNKLLPRNAEPLSRKPRLMPKAALIPKLTQAEIQRRLIKLKFPIVILAKDQVCSTVRVTKYEPPQFAGLDEHIWPFMQNWIKKDDFTNCNKENSCVYKNTTQGVKESYLAKFKNEMKNKSVLNANSGLNYKNKRKSTLALRGKNTFQQLNKPENEAPKINPMHQFKNKMLQFLYKKSNFDDETNKYPYDVVKETKLSNNYIDVGTNTQNKYSNDITHQRKSSNNPLKTGINTQSSVAFSLEQYEMVCKEERKIRSTNRNSWSKAKWASDFIDNVIKKIKSGVYYNQYEKEFSARRYCITKETSVQTEKDTAEQEYCQNCNQKTNSVLPYIKKYENLKSVPGFKNNHLDLKVESIDKKQIAIKHCITNIVVQFDVALPSETNRMLHLRQSVSFTPVKITESQTKVYKSKTSIINAMLPAELCIILPNLMRKIINNELILPKIADKVEAHLSTITELTRYESGDTLKYSIPSLIGASTKLRIVLQGKFSNNASAMIVENSSWKSSQVTLTDFLPNINMLLNCGRNSIALHILESLKSRLLLLENHVQHNKSSTFNNSTLQLYRPSDMQVVPAVTKFDFKDTAVAIPYNQNINQINPLSTVCYKSNIIISTALDVRQIKIGCIISGVNMDSLYNGFQKSFKDCEKLPCIFNFNLKSQQPYTIDKYIDTSLMKKIERNKGDVRQCVNIYNIKKKRGFIKLCNKYKSNWGKPNLKSRMALSKIKSLEDFFLALGSTSTLASIFDMSAGRKILTYIKQMKNWITDITPRQALLVLLLANKKDTPNLVRCVPIILQGIAVNRITQAAELDMEIEVIEKENLHTFSQYEGISYLPASVENQNNLLEELYWIAKTTASDYRRIFDESSERLLKSLVEKRKKLNPSYLRVMARYVGLGLLKTSK